MLYKILNDLICVNIDNCLNLSVFNTGAIPVLVKYY